ncbi:MAG TPA: glycoside hydrolase family 16 protein, partial [Tepidisphaeraceae bacterium]|nr:glycoside hydrolase family 16 protein [Tepidisphaeraceae bacterium]
APPGWKLAWNDEFDGDKIDRAKWNFDHGTFLPAGPGQWQPGWGNNELEFYTSRAQNAYVRDGMLHLRAIRENYKGAAFTSARLNTHKLFEKKYGRFEFRAKLPTGRGVWPAIWMLPRQNKYGGWAASGEIDIMEARGQEPNKVLGTLHYGSQWPANTHAGKDYILPNNATVADFHVYALEWEPGEIRWFVDDHLYQAQNFWWSCSDTDGPRGVAPMKESELNAWPAPFDQPFYLTMNVAVGGNFLGNPDAKTVFPVELVIDYVRVFDKIKGYGKVRPRGAGKLPFETARAAKAQSRGNPPTPAAAGKRAGDSR